MIKKISALSPEDAAEVETFVDNLSGDRALQHAMLAASTSAFKTIWDNPEDAVYDDL